MEPTKGNGRKLAKIIIIAAVADNKVIGDSATNSLPWPRLNGDLPRFARITTGEGQEHNALIMGRKTLASFGNKPLPNRINIVLSLDKDWEPPSGVMRFKSLGQAIQRYEASVDNIFIIGGSHVFKEGLDVADEMILTCFHQEPEGDVLFPEFDPNKWVVKSIDPHLEYDYEVIHYIRNRS